MASAFGSPLNLAAWNGYERMASDGLLRQLALDRLDCPIFGRRGGYVNEGRDGCDLLPMGIVVIAKRVKSSDSE
jgi:hypothetical protein